MNRLTLMKRVMMKSVLSLVAVVSLGVGLGTASTTAHGFEYGQKQRSWVRENYEPMRQRIETLKTKSDQTMYRYHLAKAQCWLNTSLHEYERTDGTQYVKRSYAEAERLVQLLETNKVPPMEVSVLDEKQRIRTDLWDEIGVLKGSQGFTCSREFVGCAEVHLIHATHEYHQHDWRHANPYVGIAEDFIEAAKKADGACARPAGPAPVLPTPLPAVVTRSIDVKAMGLFKFDRGDLADLLPEGRKQIDDFIAKLPQTMATVQTVRVIGHTDRLNRTKDPLYNEKLSARRALTVQTYLQSKLGPALSQAQWVNEGRAAREPVVMCDDKEYKRKPFKALTDCLQPNRRVTIEVTGTARAVSQ